MAARQRLGGTFFGWWMFVSGSTGMRASVYDLGDRLEIEERDHWLITRRRIPLRDVVLITRHRFRRTLMAVITLIPGLIFAAISLGIAITESLAPAIALAVFTAVPFLAISSWLFLVHIVEIQIQSRRVTARMRFGIRAAAGDQLRQALEARVRSAQAAVTVSPTNTNVTPAPTAAAPDSDAGASAPLPGPGG